MARENVRAQLLRLQDNPEVVFLGLQPPVDGRPDPIFVRTVSVSLTYKHAINEHDCTVDAGSGIRSGQISLENRDKFIPQKLNTKKYPYNNIEDEISRARGQAQGQRGSDGFFGLPPIEVEDLTAVPHTNGRMPAVNGSRA